MRSKKLQALQISILRWKGWHFMLWASLHESQPKDRALQPQLVNAPQAEQSLERLPNIQTSHRFRSIDLDSYWSKQSLHNHFVRSYTNWLVWRKRWECNTCAGFRTDQWIKSLAKLAKAKARERKTNTWLAAWLILFHMYIIVWIYSELHAIASESVNTVSVSRCVCVCACAWSAWSVYAMHRPTC